MIFLKNEQKDVRIPAKLILGAAETVMRGEKIKGDAGIVVVDERSIRRLNRQYLNHDYVTDVISFPLRDETNPADNMFGEVVVNAYRASREAKRRGTAMRRELLLYVVHGLLHLCGYDDDTASNAAAMRERENHYLKKIFPLPKQPSPKKS